MELLINASELELDSRLYRFKWYIYLLTFIASPMPRGEFPDCSQRSTVCYSGLNIEMPALAVTGTDSHSAVLHHRTC